MFGKCNIAAVRPVPSQSSLSYAWPSEGLSHSRLHNPGSGSMCAFGIASTHPFILSVLHHPAPPTIQIERSAGGGGGKVAGAHKCKAYAITQIQVAPLKIAFIYQLMVYGLWQKGRQKVRWKNI